MEALVTDVHFPSAVAGLRGLGRAGHRVLALAPARMGAGRWSRYATVRAVGPDARDDPTALALRVAQLARDHGPVVAYPGGEAAITALLENSRLLPPEVRFPYPAGGGRDLWELRDKRRLGALAAAAGLRTPATLAHAMARELRDARLPTPCVIKPAIPDGDRSARSITSREELADFLRGVDGSVPLLAQELVTGQLSVLAVVIGRDGRPVRWFQQAVRRTWPRDAGVSTLAVSVAPDDDLLERVSRMLAAVGYWGLAQVDVLYSGGRPVLIDVNPRFYTSLPLALACGVNLPAAWHAVAVDEPVDDWSGYRVGLVYRWLEGDLTAALRGSPMALLPGRGRPRAGAMWARDDPLPSMLLGAHAVAARVRRRLPGMRRG